MSSQSDFESEMQELTYDERCRVEDLIRMLGGTTGPYQNNNGPSCVLSRESSACSSMMGLSKYFRRKPRLNRRQKMVKYFENRSPWLSKLLTKKADAYLTEEPKYIDDSDCEEEVVKN